MNRKLKTLLLGGGIFAAVVAGIYVVYTVRQPQPIPIALPSPAPVSTPSPSPISEVPPINIIAPDDTAVDKCVLSFTVTEDLTPGLNCTSKDLYKDVASNTAGSYSLTGNKLADDFELVPGQTYIYVISYENTGTGATDGKVTDVLPEGLTYKDSSDGCTIVASTRTVTCNISSVAASGAGQVAIRFTVDSDIDTESLTNVATVVPTSGAQSTCSLTNPIKPSASPSGSPSNSPTPTPSASPVARLDCIAKRVYANAANNSAGSYYLNTEITDTNTIDDGSTVVFNVLVKNQGGTEVPDVKITDVLSSNLTYLDGEDDCSYNSSNRTVTCDVGSLAAGTETSRSFRARVAVAGTTAVANTADVVSSNGQRDSCSVTVNAAGQIVQPSSPIPTALPEAGVFEVTVGTLGLGVLLLVAGALGLLLL